MLEAGRLVTLSLFVWLSPSESDDPMHFVGLRTLHIRKLDCVFCW